jgi:hypothetical protein
MIPRGAQGIGHIATRMAHDLIPKAGDAYSATDLAFLATLIGMVAQDYDRAADVLEAEHEAICTILRKAAQRLDDADLKVRIDEALALAPKSLRVSELTARADATMRVLIDVHATVETAAAAGAEWARRLDDEIWRFLEAHVAARAYDVAI